MAPGDAQTPPFTARLRTIRLARLTTVVALAAAAMMVLAIGVLVYETIHLRDVADTEKTILSSVQVGRLQACEDGNARRATVLALGTAAGFTPRKLAVISLAVPYRDCPAFVGPQVAP